ncbi:MAG: hypothetical protein E7040_02580 [Lentisphaerae bacterium]|nr:hypothetical protein [Lentisphaerota bacterium]
MTKVLSQKVKLITQCGQQMQKCIVLLVGLLPFLLAGAQEKFFAPFGITNFEDGKTTGWAFYDHGQKSFVSTKVFSDGAFEGKYSFQIEVKNKPKVYVAFVKSVQLASGQKVPPAIKLAYRGTAPVQVLLRGHTPKKTLYQSHMIPATKEWQEVMLPIEFSEKIASLGIELRANEQGTYQFDNIRLLEDYEKNKTVLIIVPLEGKGNPEVFHPLTAALTLPGPVLTKALNDAGYQIVPVCYTPQVNAAFLRKFNIVMMGADDCGQSAFPKAQLQKLSALLKDYVEEGGGLFVTRTGGWCYGKDIEILNEIIKPYGAKILDEQVTDPANHFRTQKGVGVHFYWTGDISQTHPVTKDVKGIFYPDHFYEALNGKGYGDFTSPVKTSSDWKVLINSMKTSKTVWIKKSATPPPPTPGSYAGTAPLLAVREFGKGRVAVFPVATTIYWQDGEHVFWEHGQTANGEVNGKPGNSRKLVLNMFNWLSEPSNGIFGGYIPKIKAKAEADIGFSELNWDDVKIKEKHLPYHYVGLIGAQSNLSVGKASPESLIAAAKKAGYNYIAFTEDLAKIDAKKFQKLKEICRNSSNDKFMAYPGFCYRDESGNQWTVFSDRVTYPPTEWFSKKYPGRLAKNNSSTRSWGWPPVIMTEVGKNPEKPIFQGNFNTFAAITYRHGKMTDDSRKVLEQMLKNAYLCSPAVVHFVHTEAEIAAARKVGWQNYVRWINNNVVAGLTGTSYVNLNGSMLFMRPGFISEGPIVEDFYIVNFGKSDLTVPSNDRWRMHIRVSAANGLKEIKVIDAGRKVFRRFLPNGKKVFDTTIDGFHSSQQHFFMEITDMKGKSALSWDIGTITQENSYERCADNQNTMPRGKWWGAPKQLQNIRGYENYMAVRNFIRTGTPVIHGLGKKFLHAVEYTNGKASRFGTIFDYRYNDIYPDTTFGNDDATDLSFLAVPNELYKAQVIYKMFTCRQDSSLIYLVEGKLEVLKDFSISEFLIFDTTGRLNAGNLTYTAPDGSIVRNNKLSSTVLGKLPVNGVVGIWPCTYNGSVGFIPLTDGIHFRAWKTSPWGMLKGYYKPEKKQYKKGETISYSYITVFSALNPENSDKFLLDVQNAFGLGGKPVPYKMVPSHGKVTGTGMILKLDAKDYAFNGSIAKVDLPLDLPVEISGLNPNWDAGIIYKGKNTLQIPVYIVDKYQQRYIEQTKRIAENTLYHIPVDEKGVSMLQIDTQLGDHQIFIGNLLTADNPDLCLVLTDYTPNKKGFTVHNPTDKEITATIRPGKGMDLLGAFSKKITVKPGSSLYVKIK